MVQLLQDFNFAQGRQRKLAMSKKTQSYAVEFLAIVDVLERHKFFRALDVEGLVHLAIIITTSLNRLPISAFANQPELFVRQRDILRAHLAD